MLYQSNERTNKIIIEYLYNSGMIRFISHDNPEGWFLHSGIWSPFYINLRSICSRMDSWEILDIISNELGELIKKEMPEVNKIVGVATAGVPIATIIAYKAKIPLCYTRKIDGIQNSKDAEKKINEYKQEYGEHTVVEGELNEGDNLVLIDDLITDGDSKLIAKKLVEYEAKKKRINIICDNVAVIIDREQGGKEELNQNNVKLHSIIPFKMKGIHLLKQFLSSNLYDLIVDYYNNSEKYQDETIRKQILEEKKISL